MTKAMLVRAVNAKHALQECVRDTAIVVGKKRRGLHPRGRSHADCGSRPVCPSAIKTAETTPATYKNKTPVRANTRQKLARAEPC